jgi:negative regulator of flagellin synthesis FlgM
MHNLKGGKECDSMRIDAYNQIGQLYQTANTKNTTQTAKAKGMGRDEVQISSTGKDYHVAKAAVSEASDIREDLVADIKARIKDGTYDVSPDDFAAKLLSQVGSVL